jgi:sulfite reductase (NADPH) flavoprotein alpha-component
MRKLHRWPALIAAVFLFVLAISGTMLSVFPALEKVTMPAAKAGQSVAELATLALAAHPGFEQIRRTASGKITVWWFEGNTPASAVFDPVTGQDMGSADPNAVEQWLISFHRALFLDDTGRIVMAIAAAAMLILALSGSVLLTRRVGGWRQWFAPQKGPFAARFHTEIARLAVPILILSAITALWMTAANFDLLPNNESNPAFPQAVSGKTGFAPALIPIFQSTPVSELRDLTFPADAADVYTLTTSAGMGYIDQGTGNELSFASAGPWARIYEWIYLLHTGQGASLWGLILGLIVLSVPVLAITGTLSWAKGRRHGFRGAVAANAAQIVILVGSEGGTTWGFAATLAWALASAGQSVHLAALSSIAPERYTMARQIVVMTATWGDGAAPTSAKGALEKLSAPTVPMTVLGFGDSSFTHFCAFAEAVDQKARNKGWTMLMPMDQINRQSPQDFNRWGRAFGQALGLELDLNHQPSLPKVMPLVLTNRRDYG